MIDVFAAFVSNLAERLVVHSAKFAAGKLKKRRELLAALLRIYNCLDDVYLGTIEMLERLEEISGQESVVLQTECKSALTPLHTAAARLKKEIDQIEKELFIYASDVRYELYAIAYGVNHDKSELDRDSRGAPAVKGSIDISSILLPMIIQAKEQQAGFRLRIVTRYPVLNKNPQEQLLTRGNKESITDFVKKYDQHLIKDFEFALFDVSDKEELRKIVISSLRNVQKIAKARDNLAGLIRENYSMKELFE